MMAGFPEVDRAKIADNNFAINTALMDLRDYEVLILTELVEERGEALWGRFCAWRDGRDEGSEDGGGFKGWIDSMLQDPVNLMSIVYPKDCRLDSLLQGLLLDGYLTHIFGENATAKKAISAHFGVEPQYSAVRQIACKGCAFTSCRHWVDHRVRPKGDGADRRESRGYSSGGRAESYEAVPSDQIREQCITALRNARDKDDAKRAIKRVLKRHLSKSLRDGGNSCSVTWSTNPSARSATIFLYANKQSIRVRVT